ncbi:MAG: hypothetical protein ACLS8C_14035 [Dysgonomonas mossii]
MKIVVVFFHRLGGFAIPVIYLSLTFGLQIQRDESNSKGRV